MSTCACLICKQYLPCTWLLEATLWDHAVSWSFFWSMMKQAFVLHKPPLSELFFIRWHVDSPCLGLQLESLFMGNHCELTTTSIHKLGYNTTISLNGIYIYLHIYIFMHTHLQLELCFQVGVSWYPNVKLEVNYIWWCSPTLPFSSRHHLVGERTSHCYSIAPY